MDAVARYQQRLAARLQQTQADIIAHRDLIQQHFASYLALFHGARVYPEFHALVAECIAALHPWPTHWGYLSAWAEELGFAAAQTGHLRLMAHCAGLLQRLGKRDAAWQAAQQALELATNQSQIETIVSAGVSMIEMLRGQGQREAMARLHTEIGTCLTTLRSHVAPTTWTRAWTQFRLYSFYYRLDALQTWAEMVAETDNLIAGIESLPDVAPEDLIDTYFIGHFLYRRYGAVRKSLTVFQRKLQLERDLGYPNVDEQNAGNLALIYSALNEYDLAVAAYQRRIAWCEQTHDQLFLATSLAYFGAIYIGQKRLDEATAVLERALMLAQSLDAQAIFNDARCNLASVQLCQGNYATAIAVLELWIAAQLPVNAAYEKLNLSHAYAQLGQLDHAQKLVAEALEVAMRHESEIVKGLALRHWAKYQPPGEKAALLRQALEIMQHYERRLDAADCLLSLAGLAEMPEERTRLWNEGVCLLQEINATAWLEGASPENPPFIVAIVT